MNHQKGVASLLLPVLIVVAILIGIIGWRVLYSGKTVTTKQKSSYDNTYNYQGYLFPHLPASYSLVYRSPNGSTSYPSKVYITTKTIDKANVDALAICTAARFKLNGAAADHSGSATYNGITYSSYGTQCYDENNYWVFSITETSNAAAFDWFADLDQVTKMKMASNPVMLTVRSSGPPTYHHGADLTR